MPDAACARPRRSADWMEGPVSQRILMVCIGNICRSPTAALLLAERLRGRGFEVSSAGLAAMVDEPVERNAAALLLAHGINPVAHRARQLDAEMLRAHDRVLAMEKSHLARMTRLAPDVAERMFLLDHWSGGRDVPDPWGHSRGFFERVYAMIEQGVDGWLPHLD